MRAGRCRCSGGANAHRLYPASKAKPAHAPSARHATLTNCLLLPDDAVPFSVTETRERLGRMLPPYHKTDEEKVGAKAT